MRKLVILIALAALPAAGQDAPDAPQPQQLNCQLDAKGENGTGISCSGIEWPPRGKPNRPPAGTVDAKNILRRTTPPDLSELVRSAKYRGPEPIGIEPKRDRFKRAVPKFVFHQVADKKFWYVAVAVPVASSLFDLESTQYALRHGGSEANPIVGRRRPRQYGVKFGVQALNIFLLYKYKRWDMQDAYMGNKMDAPKWWHAAVLWPAVNFGIGIHNFVTASHRPSR